jgi:hypothetical protein
VDDPPEAPLGHAGPEPLPERSSNAARSSHHCHIGHEDG